MAVHSFSLARFGWGERRVQKSLSAHSTKTKAKQTSERERSEKSAQNLQNVQHGTHSISSTQNPKRKKNNPETQVSRTQWLKHFIFNIGLQWLLNESIVYQAIRCGSVCVKMSNLKRQSIHSMVVAAVYSIQLQFIFMFHTHFSYFSLPICACVLEFVHVFIIFNRKTISNRRFTTQENGVK